MVYGYYGREWLWVIAAEAININLSDFILNQYLSEIEHVKASKSVKTFEKHKCIKY